ncbi:MAG TPA: bifunctional alpha,alpha-trehalose-phosphate synthase (UDP-forming)/trehalose-phosphatase [Chitinispirillaceae bacterium]|nr:bifunctional alpha,alpha-trehalose-phosphate synthase (UDP-forming)/trehalose-phosphatase [Chitinispirillaceae bacterium]
MRRLLLVSNRLPVTADKKKHLLQFHKSSGGLATGLDSFYHLYDSAWIGWPGIAKEKLTESDIAHLADHLRKNRCEPVMLQSADIDHFYSGFSNKTIWPLFHYFPQNATYEQSQWHSYIKVNKLFRDAVLKIYKNGDMIWIHDYQLMLLPELLREILPEATIGFFLHIPFPSLELFRLLPWRKEILDGLLGADLIGFHTYEYIRHFLDCTRRLLGIEHIFNRIGYKSRLVQTDVFPMGIEYNKYASVKQQPKIQREIEAIRKNIGNKKMILSVDRLDYTKGIIQRLEAYDLFLDLNPSFREKVTMVLVEVPSRTAVDSYQLLKVKTDEIIGRINGKHGTIGWAPILNLYRSLPFHTLAALYAASDIAVITPLRDGMNLIAKEYVATKSDSDGVLILSELTGAAREMGEALIVNPNSIEDIAQAIKTALTMEKTEKSTRIKKLQERLRRYDINKWAVDFTSKLMHMGEIYDKLKLNCFTNDVRNEIIFQYRKAESRLLMLDYDGTLVPFQDKPELALIDDDLIQILLRINLDGTAIAVVSGRDRFFLEQQFNAFPVTLFAEHGIWVKYPDSQWHTIESLQNDWKNSVRPILDLYVDRTPGAFLEEKEYSLAWHYRNADPELASLRVLELKDALIQMISNLNLGVMDGNKVLEIKNAGIGKGLAAKIMLSQRNWEFVLAAGDDITDEDLFSVLPPETFSLKVGLRPSKARYNLKTYQVLRSLLSDLHN